MREYKTNQTRDFRGFWFDNFVTEEKRGLTAMAGSPRPESNGFTRFAFATPEFRLLSFGSGFGGAAGLRSVFASRRRGRFLRTSSRRFGTYLFLSGRQRGHLDRMRLHHDGSAQEAFYVAEFSPLFVGAEGNG
jgi:hypothetical protein